MPRPRKRSLKEQLHHVLCLTAQAAQALPQAQPAVVVAGVLNGAEYVTLTRLLAGLEKKRYIQDREERARTLVYKRNDRPRPPQS